VKADKGTFNRVNAARERKSKGERGEGGWGEAGKREIRCTQARAILNTAVRPISAINPDPLPTPTPLPRIAARVYACARVKTRNRIMRAVERAISGGY